MLALCALLAHKAPLCTYVFVMPQPVSAFFLLSKQKARVESTKAGTAPPVFLGLSWSTLVFLVDLFLLNESVHRHKHKPPALRAYARVAVQAQVVTTGLRARCCAGSGRQGLF